MSNSNGLEQFGKALRSYLKTVPRIIGRAVVQESADNFRRQGYENDEGAVVAWEPRKRADRRRGRANPRQRALLMKSGALRRSVRIVATTATTVTVGSAMSYAQAQQEGNEKMPARPFITVSPSTRAKLTKQLAGAITGLLK